MAGFDFLSCVNNKVSFFSALQSRLILVQLRLRGAACENNGSGSKYGFGSDLKSRKTQHIFFAMFSDLKNLKGAFAHDTTELQNYN